MFKRLKHKISALVIFSALIMLTTDCSGKKAAIKTVIRVALPDSAKDVGMQAMRKSLTAYEKMNPEIKIEQIRVSTGYDDKIMMLIAAGEAPDIFRTSPDRVSYYIRKNAVMPIDDFIARSKTFKLTNLFESTLFKYRFDGQKIGSGKIYGCGTDFSPDQTIIYNSDLLEECGLSMAQRSMSWEEYVLLAKKITSREGAHSRFGSLEPMVSALVLQNGGTVFSDDGKKCMLDTPAAEEAFEFWINLSMKHRVAPSAAERQDTDTISLFSTSRLAMIFSGRFFASTLINQNLPFNWSVAPTIHREGRERVNMMAGPYGWVISSRIKNPEEVWKLFEYLVVGKGAERLSRIGYNIPIVKSYAYSDLFLNNRAHPKGMNQIFLDEVPFTLPSPMSAYVDTGRMYQIFAEVRDLTINKKIVSGKYAAKEAARQINALIKDEL